MDNLVLKGSKFWKVGKKNFPLFKDAFAAYGYELGDQTSDYGKMQTYTKNGHGIQLKYIGSIGGDVVVVGYDKGEKLKEKYNIATNMGMKIVDNSASGFKFKYTKMEDVLEFMARVEEL